MAVTGLALVGPLLPQQAQAMVYNPAFTTTNVLGGNYSSNPSSFGFYFDTDRNVGSINGLGFARQTDNWDNNTAYDVTLWKYNNGGFALSDYSQIATARFTEENKNSYTLQDNFYWLPIAGPSLSDTFTNDPGDLEGYVIAAIGNFSGSNGNVKFLEGTASFDSGILNAGNGSSAQGDPLYPIPFFPTPGVGTNGYFNANFSTAVPGPLPLVGAVVGFSWTRRMRKRILASQ